MTFILTVLGVLLVFEGIPYLAFPSKVREWALMLGDVDDRSLRLLGLLSMAAGLVLILVLRLF